MAYKMVVSQEIVDYLQKFYDLGAFEQKPDGVLTINPKVEEAFKAAHAILAGGTAKISYAGEDPARMAELDNLKKAAIDSVMDLDIAEGDAPMAP